MFGIFRKRIKYTPEMKKQDELWEMEYENLAEMEKLQKAIIEEAKRKGFKGATKTYKGDNEIITEVFRSLEDMKLEEEKGNGLQIAICGYCKSLIETLENEINRR